MIPKRIILLLIGLVPLAQAAHVANLHVSETTAAQYGCNATCYKNFKVGLATDLALYGTIYDEDFYATASNFSRSKLGDVLKSKPVNGTLLRGIPAGTAVYKFQYASQDLNGKKVPATGFIAFPYASRSNGHKFRPVAFAHGTAGVFRGCAPSAMPTLYEYGSWAYILSRGYAIIATDYAGLGNNYTGHQYEASKAQANNVYYSVAAAYRLFSASFTDEWLSVGHSQGGAAA